VLSLPKIEFENFDVWEKSHFTLLRFIGFDLLYSQCGKILVGDYRAPIFADKQSSMFQGLLFLASLEDHTREGYGKPEHEVFDMVENLLLEGLVPFLHLIYWSTFMVEIVQREKEKELDSLAESIQSWKEKKTVHTDVYQKILDSYRIFKRYYIEEIRNLKKMKRNVTSYKPIVKDCQPLKSMVKINVFQNMVDGSERFLEAERETLDTLKEQYDLTLNYCNNLTNMSLQQSNLDLQKNMWRMTIAIVFLTIVSILIPILDKYGSLIWKILTN
jgi:hypothetical protein